MDEVTALLITMTRCYDLLMVIARSANPDEAELVATAHERGHLFMPPPAYIEFKETNDEVP